MHQGKSQNNKARFAEWVTRNYAESIKCEREWEQEGHGEAKLAKESKRCSCKRRFTDQMWSVVLCSVSARCELGQLGKEQKLRRIWGCRYYQICILVALNRKQQSTEFNRAPLSCKLKTDGSFSLEDLRVTDGSALDPKAEVGRRTWSGTGSSSRVPLHCGEQTVRKREGGGDGGRNVHYYYYIEKVRLEHGGVIGDSPMVIISVSKDVYAPFIPIKLQLVHFPYCFSRFPIYFSPFYGPLNIKKSLINIIN